MNILIKKNFKNIQTKSITQSESIFSNENIQNELEKKNTFLSPIKNIFFKLKLKQ